MTVYERLAAIRARVDALPPAKEWAVRLGPNGYPQSVHAVGVPVLIAETYIGPEVPPVETEFIAAARRDVPDLLGAVTAVMATHLSVSTTADNIACDECWEPYPCATVRAIEKHLSPTATGETDD